MPHRRPGGRQGRTRPRHHQSLRRAPRPQRHRRILLLPRPPPLLRQRTDTRPLPPRKRKPRTGHGALLRLQALGGRNALRPSRQPLGILHPLGRALRLRAPIRQILPQGHLVQLSPRIRKTQRRQISLRSQSHPWSETLHLRILHVGRGSPNHPDQHRHRLQGHRRRRPSHPNTLHRRGILLRPGGVSDRRPLRPLHALVFHGRGDHVEHAGLDSRMGYLRPEVELDHAPIPAREDGVAQVLGECGEVVREAGAGVQQSVAVEVDQEGQVSGRV
mmetsp:Transcript_16701/g.34840  ORF Transcript_16701/g.34840 Transcript_16701/m.34840 type:complete len:274 (-) Transcript_16701:347-1168(-)